MKQEHMMTLARSSAALALISAWQPALAQDNTSDIIVTARRVEERLQDVPISITVFNQQQLTNRNIVNAGDIATYTPSLSANSRFGSENTSFAIRGFVQDNGTAPSVAVYFNDVVALRAGGGTTVGNGAGPGAMFDLQSLQVLKGPQGTLFGRNTTGGAVLLVPQKPTGKLEGYVEGSVGNYDMRRVQAVVNVPVLDTLRVRIGVDRQTRDGFLNNRSGVGPRDFADVDYWAARASVVADLTSNLENYLVASFSRSDTNGFLPKVYGCNTASTRPEAIFGCAQVARAGANGYGYYDVENAVVSPQQLIQQWQLINTTTWKASDTLTIKNIASYGEFRETFRSAVYGENLILTGGANAGRGFSRIISAPFPGRDIAAQSTFTEELQFQGSLLDSRLNWQAGAYMELSNPLGFSGALTPNYAICATTDVMACTSAGVGTASASARSNKTFFQNYGAYAQATYKLTEQLAVTGGLRYTWDYTKVISRGITYPSLPNGGNPPLGVCQDVLKFGNPGSVTNVNRAEENCQSSFTTKSDKPTWIIGLDYKPMEDILVYAKYARGYRAGGVKPEASGLETFQPEKVDSYEVGFKTSWRGPVRGTFNVSAFYNDFSNQQLTASAQPCCGNPNTTPQQIIVNAGQSRIKGVEVEASVQPFRGLTIDGSYAYLDTELKSASLTGISPSFLPPALTGARVGAPLSLAPKNKFTLTGTYTLPLDESIGRVSFGATYTHIDSNFATTQLYQLRNATTLLGPNGPLYGDVGLLPAVNLVNLNMNWNSIGGRPVDLSFFMTNVTKQKFPVAVFGGMPSFGFDAQATNEPRMYGFRLKYRFGS